MKSKIPEFTENPNATIINHFIDFLAVSKLKLLTFLIYGPSCKTKRNETGYSNKKRKNEKLKFQKPSSFDSSRYLTVPTWSLAAIYN